MELELAMSCPNQSKTVAVAKAVLTVLSWARQLVVLAYQAPQVVVLQGQKSPADLVSSRQM
jgi:hypothetical protein